MADSIEQQHQQTDRSRRFFDRNFDQLFRKDGILVGVARSRSPTTYGSTAASFTRQTQPHCYR
ncbi:hypothetical protein QT970_05590 [Microcoleus sp. herbarium8]|uniref:hypothetical protein n=1 Tax=Microcoleus sp. herbarium8 TaxID=3055436 RepID=UPI002FD20072